MSYYLAQVFIVISAFFPMENSTNQVSYTIHTNQQFKHTSVIVYKKAPTPLVKVFNN